MNAEARERISRFDPGEPFRDRFGHSHSVVHRADLHLALLNAARRTGMVELRTSHCVTGHSRQGTRTTLHLIGDDVFHPDHGAPAARDEIFSGTSNEAFYPDVAWLYTYRERSRVPASTSKAA